MTILVSEHDDISAVGYSNLERRLSDFVFFAGLGLLLVLAFWYGRGLWFYSDEWNIIATHHSGNWTQGFNGQWILVPVAAFWVLLKLFGLFNYLPFRLVGLAVYALTIVLFHRWARRRIRPAAAALAALAIAWYSTSWNVVMMPLLMNFTIPVAMLFASWMLLDRSRRGSNIGVAVCLLIGALSSTVGLIVVGMIGLEFLFSRTRWRRWWILVPPVVVSAVWYLVWYEPVGPIAQPLHAFHWGVGLTESYARGFASGWSVGQWIWLGVLCAFLVWTLVRRRWNPRSIALGCGLVVFVFGAAFRAADFHIHVPPDPNWYLWLYSVLVMTLFVETIRDLRIPLAALAVVALVVASGAFQLHRSLGDFRANGVVSKGNVRAWFAAADTLGSQAPDDALLRVNLVPVRAGDYASLRRDMGSLVPGVKLAQLGDQPTRQAVDGWMLENLGVHVERGAVSGRHCDPAEHVTSWTGETLPRGAVVQITTNATAANVRLRRFSSSFYVVPFVVVQPHRVVHFSIPHDNSPLPWYLYVDFTGKVEVCP